MEAKSHYERAVKAERQFTNNAYTALVSVPVGIGEIYLEDGNIDGAIKHFNSILTNTPPYCMGPFELALVEFSLAKVWEKVGDKEATRAHALKAKSVLQPMAPRPYLDQDITDLLSRLLR